MRVLITEEALQNGDGHWPSYLGTIARHLRASGDSVDILGHRQASERLKLELGVTSWFRRNCWLDARSQGALGGIVHNLSFRADLSRWLKSHDPYDWVCAPTMRLQHLLAFALLSRSARLPRQTRFLLLFVQGFGRYAGAGSPSEFPDSASNRLARMCFRLLGPAVRCGRVVLAAETRGMQDELQRFTALPVALFPHPVEAIPECKVQKTEKGGSMHSLPPDSDHAPAAKYKEFLTITCPGFARHEKGNDLLQQAIKTILSSPDGGRFRFVMQWPNPFAMPDGSLLGSDPALAIDPRVEFLNQNLDEAAYEALMARSDLVILPYRRSSYHHRVSRVAIEAASRGIPLIYTYGTWTEEIAELAGCGVVIRSETSQAVVDALMTAAREFPGLTSFASGSAIKVSNYHSAARFRSLLVGGA